MKRNFINKIILGTVISTTLFTLVPSKASAEWINDYQGNWYYMQGDQRLTGWKKIDGQVYYFDNNGRMQKGWIKAGDSWYYLQNNGALKYGWINYSKNWYYADSSGAIQTGILNIAGKVYAFDDNGILKTRNVVVNGEFYTIGLNGEIVGSKVPTPDKEYDEAGNLIKYLTTADKKVVGMPTDSIFYQVPEDKTWNDADPNEGRTFKVDFRDSNGSELKSEDVKYGKSIDLYTPTKFGYIFSNWNTKVDGSGKDYDDSDSIKVDKDIILYAQWTKDNSVFVDDITIKGSPYVTVNKTSQMTAEVSPTNAKNNAVKWSVADGTGKATIDSNGVLTGVSAGTVTVKATSKDGSNITANKQVTVTSTDVVIPVTKITIGSKTGIYAISTDKGTLQLTAGVIPNDANSQDVTWSIVDGGTGSASIDPSTGLITAVSNGTVVVKASATDNSGVSATRTITITGQTTKIPITGLTVTDDGDGKITSDSGTLQMCATPIPSSASNGTVTWKVDPDLSSSQPGSATIDKTTGVLTALSDGSVIVTATSTENSSINGTKTISISGQSKKVTEIRVTAKDINDNETDTISTDGQTLKMVAELLPSDAANKEYTWEVDPDPNDPGKASISTDGVLTPKGNGKVIVKAISKNGTGVYGEKTITISGQTTKVSGITSITADGNVSELNTMGGTKTTLQMHATVTPLNANNPAVKWSVDDTAKATIATIDSSSGLLTVLPNGKNGTVLVTATTTDGTNITRSKAITISGQIIPATGVTVTAKDGLTTIKDDYGTLQMSAAVQPSDATNKLVTWTVVSDPYIDSDPTKSIVGGQAKIDPTTGLLTALVDGRVKVIATAKDGVTNGTYEVMISGQTIQAKSIIVKTEGDVSTVSATGTGVKVSVALNPNDTSNPANADISGVVWSVDSFEGAAIIDQYNVLSGTKTGRITVAATITYKDGTKVVGTLPMTVN